MIYELMLIINCTKKLVPYRLMVSGERGTDVFQENFYFKKGFG